MKKIISVLLAVLLAAAMLLSVSAEDPEGTIYSNKLETIPADLQAQDPSLVTAVSGSSLVFEVPAKKTFTSDIEIGQAITAEKFTVTLYFRYDYSSSWDTGVVCRFPFSHSAGSFAAYMLHPNHNLFIYKNGSETVDTGKTLQSGTWYRLDILADHTAKTNSWFLDGEELGTFDYYADMAGFNCLFWQTASGGGNSDNKFFFDNMMVREGNIEPKDGDAFDVWNTDDQSVLFASTLLYNATAACVQGKDKLDYMKVADIGKDTPSLKIVTSTEKNLDVAIPFSQTEVTDNLTVSFTLSHSYSDTTHPGYNIKLTNADDAVLGGFAIGSNNQLYYNNGTKNTTIKDTSGHSVILTSGLESEYTLLVNRTQKTVTLFRDGVKIRALPFEGDVASVSQILITKYKVSSTTDAFMNIRDLTVRTGLYDPATGAALLATDEIMKNDDEVVTTTQEKTTTAKPSDNTTAKPSGDTTTEKPAGEGDATTAAPKAEEKGCASVVLGWGSIAALIPAALLIKRKKED